MSSISQMERSSSQTRMLATRPPFRPTRCKFHGGQGVQLRFGRIFGLKCRKPPSFGIEPPQPQHESGSLPRLGPCPNFAFMRLYDLVDDRQSETGAPFKVRLEGFEYLLRLLRSHSGSCIRKAHLPVVSQTLDGHLKSTAGLHGSHRALRKVPKDLFDFVSVGENPRFRSHEPALYGDAGIAHGHAMSDQSKRIFQQSNQIGFVKVIFLATRISQKIGDDPVQPPRFPGNDVEQPAVLIAQFRYAGEHADRTGNGSKGIANLVGNSRRQSTYGGQAVLHADFALQSPDLGQVLQSVEGSQATAPTHLTSGHSYRNRIS